MNGICETETINSACGDQELRNVKEFDLINAPLHGTNLIEAGAGTGKTYTIESLFIRLIIENNLTVDQILVVTFTKAATEELRDRIRNKLVKAKEAFTKGESSDRLIDSLCKKYDDHALARELMNKALIDFNEASIFTIHGFCARILSENSFETGNLFDTELVTDQTDLIQDIAEDFWRIYFYDAEPEFIKYSVKKLKGPGFFSKLLSKQVSSCKNIIPIIEKPGFESLLYDYRNLIQRIRSIWSVSKNDISYLLHDPALNGKIYGSVAPDDSGCSARERKILSLLSLMDGLLDERSSGFPLFEKFEYFTAEKIKKSVKAKQKTPEHPFFDICDEFAEKNKEIEAVFDRYILHLKREFLRYAETELVKRKKSINIQYYEDLLARVRDALVNSRDNHDLAIQIRRKYKAALIDEFQDTDPVQYEIFSNLFDSKESVLFIIGDPKQAIYSFRGADIFSYINAASKAGSKSNLTENWRSVPGLIDAVNALFSDLTNPYIFDDIAFFKGVSGYAEEYKDKDVSSHAPLTLWHLFSDEYTENNKSIKKDVAEKVISESVASEILRLLKRDNGVETSIRAGDIAILVRTNNQAQTVKTSLSKRRVPSVIYSIDNVFDSHEAIELERFLGAVSDPSNMKNVRSALVTDIFGISGEELDIAGQDPLIWDQHLAVFAECHYLWNKQGFINMFRHFMTQKRVRERLVLFHNGERRITNLLHLSEILHKVSVEKKPGMTGLVRWLSEQREASRERLEEHLLRLESDDDAVKIVTIHKSKGLEFPVVFCPFNWGGSEVSDKEIIFHDESKERNLVLDLGRNEKSLSAARKELLSENIRLLYVALTRAKKRCYLVWGRINSAETSAMAYLFHYARNNEHDSDEDIVTALRGYFNGRKNSELLDDLKMLEKRAEGAIDVSVLPSSVDGKYDFYEGAMEQLFSRNFTGKIDDTFKISSYSSLTAGSPASHDIRDIDAGTRTEFKDSPEPHQQSGMPDIFSFPRGARAGIFFHDLFEQIGFSYSEAGAREELVAGKLREYGFGAIWKDTVCDMINKVLDAPLYAKEMTIKLSGVDKASRVNEMEFYFPLKMTAPVTIKKVFQDYGRIMVSGDYPVWFENLQFSPSKGFMKGYMDMVFSHEGCYFLVDWKSNYLGNAVSHYGKSSINEVMEKESYILQYHLYVLALHQYLRLKTAGYNYKDSFGGVFYIFMRGVDDSKTRGTGIFYDLPDISLINGLGKALIPGYCE
ncbi:MAG: exodeoxyribonuclease V subunit beta [Proteobacteria bacterium]|nr:exodeoxyribonuclease V subunit beta [Pseudomonadota bacterium]